MTDAARSLVESFDRLSEQEQADVATELSRRNIRFGAGDLDDETLAQIADDAFLMFDLEEAQQHDKG